MSNCDFLSQYFDLFRLNVLFNPSTTISFTIPERTRLVLSVYNELGQKVGVLEPLERGNGSI
jgi:hypothetical protein